MEASVNIKAALFWAIKLMHSSKGKTRGRKGLVTTKWEKLI